MAFLNVDSVKCTKCNTCIVSCPVSCISSDKETKLPKVVAEKEATCVYCGHCESVCPENALVHSLSKEALMSAKEQNEILKSDELALYFKERRSIRNFKKDNVERKLLEQALDVARYSPTGHNRQLNQWIVVYDSKKVQELAAATIDWMRIVVKANPEMASRYGFDRLVVAFDRGYDGICRNAPHVIITYTPTSHTVGAKDATIAATHLELFLPSQGLGACWAGYLYMAFQQSAKLKELVGLDENSTVHAALLVGFPKFGYQKIPARKKADVKWL